MRLWPGYGFTFLFHYKPFPGQTRKERDKERERRESYRSTRSHPSIGATSTPASAPPYILHHHRDRITTEDRSTQTDRTPPKTDPPEPITPRPIHRRSHHPRSIAPHWDHITLDRSSQNRSHRHRHYPWPISSPSCRYPSLISSPSRRYPSPKPISPFPSIFDHSLFLPLSVWSNGGV